ncbi:HTH-type transcriptional regulator GltC [Paraburkholderia aspalathi]|uniref:LysR family transcriptional regulator n=1 Tax=Paraburkholderia aspalathi TaxID=1324617 RepID=UPI001B16AF43|nr:LysR family transcriptional regulator [Paraburkholderia aspalathi]CAE6869100.1 HTH-type transcriptional regulator GltC [Paraburkholderia aspalathi]
MNLRFLETFVWAARLDSFALVADKLHISQAAVSARIGTLEQELGVKLFRRDGKINALTEHGERALVAAERLLRYAADFNEQVNDGGNLRGTIRIGVSDTIAFTLLPAIVKHLRAAYPKVNFELHAGQSVDLVRDLADSKLHLILAMGTCVSDQIISRPLLNLGATWVASPHLDLDSTLSSFESLGEVPVISYPKGSIPYETFRGYLDPQAFSQLKICWSNSLATIVRLARDGLGIALVPEAVVTSELARGELAKLASLPRFPPFEFQLAHIDTSDSALRGQLANLIASLTADYCRDVGGQLAWVPSSG